MLVSISNGFIPNTSKTALLIIVWLAITRAKWNILRITLEQKTDLESRGTGARYIVLRIERNALLIIPTELGAARQPTRG
jgi:hypothetical protein